ncbi:MAG: C69 family dipeptidase [Rikenellaceae bacterium]
MRKLILSTLFIILFGAISFAQRVKIDPYTGANFAESCTSIVVGKNASTDGSTMTSHTCDGNYRAWLNIAPRKKFATNHKDTVLWGLLNTEEVHDTRGVTVKGTIPSIPETYAYLNTAYPCMNEKQLAIGEATFSGRGELINTNGLFLIEELERIVLQRTTTAREAIALIGKLVAEYGYGDEGETLTIIDPNETWMLEIVGSGTKGKPSALWAAQRIPDDHVGITANISRIGEIDFNNPDYFMYSADLKDRSKKLGYWDGKETFKFYKVSSGEKPFQIREFFVLNALAPSLKLSMDADELPFSVKPDKKVSPQQVLAFFRETYEGTEWDMCKNLKVTVKTKDENGKDTTKVITSPIVNNWSTRDFQNLANALQPDAIKFNRTVAVCWCSYSQIIQCRSWLPDEIGAVAYFAFDNPGQSPRIPIYAGTLNLPESFGVSGQFRYRTDAAQWQFREANRLAQVAWGKTRGAMESEVSAFETKMFTEMPALEERAQSLIKEGKAQEAKELVTRYTHDFSAATMTRWQELKAKYWARFARGF